MVKMNNELRQQYREAYNALNPTQQKAVDTIEGPVMVIAGPGTGKTQILGARIAKILLDTDTRPENILCLTYTDAGVVAMRKRLLQFIGPDAYKVNIYTFHAFCNDVIQENLPLFEKHVLDPVSDLERIEMMKELIDGFPKNHPLKRYRGNVYFEIKGLTDLFSVMKKEGWTPEGMNQKIDEYIASLPEREEYITKRATKEFKKGDLRTDKIEEEKGKIEKLRAAVNAFEPFQEIMRSRNRYDFDDMINWVIRAFSENEQLLRHYQEQYLYILVDEYQDTSGSQNKLVAQLIAYWDMPNIFVVGDDDQSIYRFQGANVENMLNFADTYQQQLRTLVLTQNYRSTQPILDASKKLIDSNEERLVKQLPGLSKELLSSRPGLMELKHTPVIREYLSPRQEMAAITLEIAQLVKEKQVPPGRIAVIYKENKYGEELALFLQARDVPVYSKRNLNLFTIPLAQQLIRLLKYLDAEHDTTYGGDGFLFEILHINWFNIPSVDIARLTAELADKNSSGAGPRSSLRQYLHTKSTEPQRELFSTGIHEHLKRASRIIEALLSAVPNTTLQGLMEQIIREAGVLAHILKQPDKVWQMQVLTAMFEFVKEETRRNPTLRLHQLVETLDTMEKEGLVLPLVQVSGNDKGVNLLTAHGSKGLEYEYVFLAGCNASFWEKKRKPGGGYKMPDTLFSSTEGASGNENSREELRRLFYVALTRAEKHLYISYARFKDDNKELEPSMFLAEIQQENPLPVERPVVSPEMMAEFNIVNFSQPAAPEIERLETEFITRVLERFTMNVTALSNYLKCPLEFYFRSLIRIPSPKNEATEFGSAVHHAVEQLFRKMQDMNKQFPPMQVFLEDFSWYMYRHRESFTKEQFERRMEYGKEILANYYQYYIDRWNKVVVVERNIRNVVVDGVPLKGKLDKLEFDGSNVNVVDYKSGDPDNGIKKLAGPSEKEPNGGDYWRQAVFYKILVDGYENRDWKVISSEFDFIEPDKKKQYRKEKVLITDADTTTVKQQIKTVWERIQAHDFYTGCGASDCHWCNFVKTNELAVSLHTLNPDEGEA